MAPKHSLQAWTNSPLRLKLQGRGACRSAIVGQRWSLKNQFVLYIAYPPPHTHTHAHTPPTNTSTRPPTRSHTHSWVSAAFTAA